MNRLTHKITDRSFGWFGFMVFEDIMAEGLDMGGPSGVRAGKNQNGPWNSNQDEG